MKKQFVTPENAAEVQGHVRDFMTVAPISVAPDTSVDTVYALMQQHHLRHLPVLKSGRLLGMVSDRDVSLARPTQHRRGVDDASTDHLSRLKVREIMMYFPVTIDPERSLAAALTRMRAYKVETFPVVENDRLVGILTRANLLDALQASSRTVDKAA
jgi:acetoin utilization protein AcuB